MLKFTTFSLLAVLCFGAVTESIRAEDKEKVEVKQKKDGSWKMKVERKGDKYVGVHEGRNYELRGDARFTEPGEYTVYGVVDPGDTYITTTRVERVEVPVTTTTTRVETPVVTGRVERDVSARDEGEWRMRISRRGDDWIGVHEGKTFVLRGDVVGTSVHGEGEYTVHGRLGDGFITTSRVVRVER